MLGPYEPNCIYTGDARELAEQIPDESIDLMLHDPPFGINFGYSNGYKDDPKAYPDLLRWTIAESDRIVKPGGLCFVFVAQPQLRQVLPLFPEHSRLFAACKNFVQFRPVPVQFAYDPVVFWQKVGNALVVPVAGRRDWHIGNTALYVTQETFHSCPRPLNTITYMVDNFSPDSGTVCDFFMGSGTTAIAARVTGRRFIGFEIDPDTAALARERVRNTQPPLLIPQAEQLELV